MEDIYYVIVDLENLCYQKNGESADLKEADKFKNLKEAQKELEYYDKDFNGAIYEVREKRSIQLTQMQERRDNK